MRDKVFFEFLSFPFLWLLANERGWVDNGGQTQKSDQQETRVGKERTDGGEAESKVVKGVRT